MAPLMRNPMRNNFKSRSRLRIKVEIHSKLLFHSIQMQCTHFKVTLYDTNIGKIPQIGEQFKNNQIVKKSVISLSLVDFGNKY